MSILHLNLAKPSFPTEENHNDEFRSSDYCPVCLDLNGLSAMRAFPRRGLWTRESSLDQAIVQYPKLFTLGYYASFDVLLNFSDLKQKAASGCASCTLIEAVIKAVIREFIDRPFLCGDDLVVNLVFGYGSVLRVVVDRARKGDDESDASHSSDESVTNWGGPVLRTIEEEIVQIELYTLPDQPCPWPTIGSSMRNEQPANDRGRLPGGAARHVFPNTKTEACFALIREWIDTCANTHDACRDTDAVAGHGLPTRLVHVGDNDNTSIRLIESEQMNTGDDAPQYVALSHCWGDSKHLTLLKGRVVDMKKNMAWSTLPPTFQDAVLITRRLGYQFLWIDSLCIIQDDPGDWEAEAARMASVYGDAHLVLSATSSANGNGGCLADRDKIVEIRGAFDNAHPFQLFARREREHKVFGRGNPATDTIISYTTVVKNDINLLEKDYPLLSRAWCFQERLLATRILHFVADEMIYDCLSGVNCECGALEDFSEDPLRLSRHFVKFEQRSRLEIPAGMSESEYVHHRWRRLLVWYSEKKITKSPDTLSALAGVARKWSHHVTPAKYLAGFWTDDISKSLLWTVSEHDVQVSRFKEQSKEYIAPSWSWASSQQPVTWGSNHFTDCQYFAKIDLDSSGCQAKGPDPFGRIEAGWLCITGRTFEALITQKPNDRRIFLHVDGYPRDTFLFEPDNPEYCQALVGQHVTCLIYSSVPPFVYEVMFIVLVPALPSCIESLPPDVQKFPHVFQRLGLMARDVDGWDYVAHSKELTFYFV